MGTTKQSLLTEYVILPKIIDESTLIVGESGNHIPFSLQRFYTISSIDSQSERGKHAHRKTRQVLFCLQGEVTILLDNGITQEWTHLTEPHIGIMLEPYIWHEMLNFSKDCLLLVLASELYDEADYIRDYEVFCAEVKEQL